jgi:hypothetical protein
MNEMGVRSKASFRKSMQSIKNRVCVFVFALGASAFAGAAEAPAQIQAEVPVSWAQFLAATENEKIFLQFRANIDRQSHFQRGELINSEIRAKVENLFAWSRSQNPESLELWAKNYAVVWIKYFNAFVFEEETFSALKWVQVLRVRLFETLAERIEKTALPASELKAGEALIAIQESAYPLDRIFLAEARRVLPAKAMGLVVPMVTALQKKPVASLQAVIAPFRGHELAALKTLAAKWSDVDVALQKRELELREKILKVTSRSGKS